MFVCVGYKLHNIAFCYPVTGYERETFRGYFQEALADLAGFHWTYLGGIERGERNPTLKNIIKLVKALNNSLCELFAYAADSV